jgi:hypothetical protein
MRLSSPWMSPTRVSANWNVEPFDHLVVCTNLIRMCVPGPRLIRVALVEGKEGYYE